MKDKFLTKNTKITINEVKPNGLKTAEKVYDEDGKINKKALKDFSKKLSDYYNFDDGEEDALKDPPKVGRDDELEGYEVEAKGAGKMSSYKYDDEDTEVYEKFVERIDDLNDTSEYDKLFGTTDGFGEGKKDNVWDDVKKYSDKYKEYKYDEPDQYQLTPRVRVTKGVTESKVNKTNKMKRLNFKNEFKSDSDMVGLIPENYKKDGNTFLMTDGNKLYKVRWDNTLNEATILNFKDKSMIVENRNKMKKLYNYKYSDSMGKTNDYVTESQMMRNMMVMVKDKSFINEQEEVEVDPFDDAVIQQKADDKAAADKVVSDKAAADKAAIPKPVTSYVEKTYKIGGQDIIFRYPQISRDGGKTQEDAKKTPIIIRGPKGLVLVDKKTHKVIQGDPKKLFNYSVNSSPNGSMMTAHNDFIKYVKTKLPNAQYKDFGATDPSQGSIEKSLTLLPQYYITNKDQQKDFRIVDKTIKNPDTGQPYTWIIRVKYVDNVDGNGVLKKKIVNDIMWLDPSSNTKGIAIRPHGSGGKDFWYDDKGLASGKNKNIILPGSIVTQLGDLMQAQIIKTKAKYERSPQTGRMYPTGN